MPINCADCHGELDPAYFDTHCRECARPFEEHTDDDAHTCGGEWRQKVLLCESCEARDRNQDSYDNLTPWQQWRR